MQNSLPSLLEVGRSCCQCCQVPSLSPGTKALGNEDSPWAPGQMLSHFTDGFAEA